MKHIYIVRHCSAEGQSPDAPLTWEGRKQAERLSGNHRNVVLVTHGNLMTLLLRHFDERFGFQEWAALTNPDVYRVTVDESETTVEGVWE